MTNPKISVIVPVYNVEKYLHRCIDSILAQTYTDFELLLINDGSKDNSGIICDEYAAKDNRVRVFHKENGGVSRARNLGLDNAKGEWIAFIDSDDWVKPGYLRSMVVHSGADMIMSSFEISDDLSIWNNDIDDEAFSICQMSAFLNKYVSTTHFGTPWCKLYNRDLIGNLRFNDQISLAEDTIFIFNYLVRVRSVRTVKDFSYQYNRGVVDSLSRKLRTIEEYRRIIKENYDGLKELELRFDYNGEEVRHARTSIIFEQCLSVIKIERKPIIEKYRLIVYLLQCKEIYEMIRFQGAKFKGKRRCFFDYLAIHKCYWILFVYVICKKGCIY